MIKLQCRAGKRAVYWVQSMDIRLLRVPWEGMLSLCPPPSPTYKRHSSVFSIPEVSSSVSAQTSATFPFPFFFLADFLHANTTTIPRDRRSAFRTLFKIRNSRLSSRSGDYVVNACFVAVTIVVMERRCINCKGYLSLACTRPKTRFGENEGPGRSKGS